MKSTSRLLTAAGGAAALAGLGLGLERARRGRHIEKILDQLSEDRSTRTFSPESLAELPDAARRYFLHAIRPGTRLAQVVRLRLAGRMRPREDADFIHLTADETLDPARGFVWTARFKVGPLPIRVRDHYWRNEGGVEVSALSILPLSRDVGPDIGRSSRHRSAGEAVWLPSALLPSSHARWSGIDASRARVEFEIDGEVVPLTLKVDETGRLLAITMMRYGSVGVPDWQLIPYGFAVEEERDFGGFTIPSRIRGGWWYGTGRYNPDGAAIFEVLEAEFDSRS